MAQKAGFKTPRKESSNMPKGKNMSMPKKNSSPKKHDCGCGGRGK